jgi:hypothetical protein
MVIGFLIAGFFGAGEIMDLLNVVLSRVFSLLPPAVAIKSLFFS